MLQQYNTTRQSKTCSNEELCIQVKHACSQRTSEFAALSAADRAVAPAGTWRGDRRGWTDTASGDGRRDGRA